MSENPPVSPETSPDTDAQAVTRLFLSLRVMLVANVLGQGAAAVVFWLYRGEVNPDAQWARLALFGGAIAIVCGLTLSAVLQFGLPWIVRTARSLRSAVSRYTWVGFVSVAFCDLGGMACLVSMLLGRSAQFALLMAAIAAIWPLIRWWPIPARLREGYDRLSGGAE